MITNQFEEDPNYTIYLKDLIIGYTFNEYIPTVGTEIVNPFEESIIYMIEEVDRKIGAIYVNSRQLSSNV